MTSCTIWRTIGLFGIGRIAVDLLKALFSRKENK